MNIEDLRMEWNRLETGVDQLRDAALLAHVQERARDREATIRRRDRREAIAAGIVCAFFLLPLISGPWLTRVGALVFMAGSALAVYLMRRARREGQPAHRTRSLAEALDAERSMLEAQIRLLQRVFWWYGLPLGVGIVLIVVGSAGVTWLTMKYTVVVAAMVAGIVALNRREVRRELLPALEELDRLRAQLQTGTDMDSDGDVS